MRFSHLTICDGIGELLRFDLKYNFIQYISCPIFQIRNLLSYMRIEYCNDNHAVLEVIFVLSSLVNS